MSWFIIDRLFLQHDFKAQLVFCLQQIRHDSLPLLLLAALLMPVNWGLETLKWKILLRTDVSFFRLLQSVIAGITVGFVTPGRSGEFIGRVLFLNDDNKTRAFYLSSLGGLAQTAASLMVGIPFVLLWHNDILLAGIVTGSACIYLLAFLRFDLLNRIILKLPFLHSNGLTIEQSDLPDINVQLWILVLSFLRFGVYLLQYVILLFVFGVSNNSLALFTHSTVYLLAQTFSPLMPLLDFSYRGASALYVFQNISSNSIAILSAVMLVWLINLVVPAILGYVFIVRRKEIRLPWI